MTEQGAPEPAEAPEPVAAEPLRQIRCGICGQCFWGPEALAAHRPDDAVTCAPGSTLGMRDVDQAWMLPDPPA
jgi:hypothetical protein